MRKVTPKADPAPSRWAYRMQRIMLTPTYRMGLRIGLPFVLSAGIVTAYLSSQDRQDAIRMQVAEIRNYFETRPQFMVKLMSVEGVSRTVEEDIREVSSIDFPVSSFDLDLDALHNTIASIPAIASVSLRVRAGGVLDVQVTERQPVMLWRSADGLALIDREGVIVGGLNNRLERPDLPLVVGEGADKAVPEALLLMAAAEPILDRVRGLVRVGDRRWDVALDRDQRIMLPEQAPVTALESVIALNQAQDVLDRDLAAVDMRLASRPTIRMNEDAVQMWWKIKDIVVETNR
ncbi:cell division protein FtsQ [Oceanicola sp. 22II-s10i]|uniref:cell division protein FtsQ/DivIB n=1 Tax=Oceanicola sp. 22II-s10i TaxID=1317116 RepID=UPI000B52379F|nr:cell division protein FtsQ/DivIB [Oceanicola sp. 22II-s10i]OWU83958.1 cell division protein FtsQ [Oceanicola sp. 22II-s10i]